MKKRLLLTLTVIAALIIGGKIYQTQIDKQYSRDVLIFAATAAVSVGNSEAICNEYISVWKDAINREGRYANRGSQYYGLDFNDALPLAKKQMASAIEENKRLSDSLNILIHKIASPGEKHKDAYNMAATMYARAKEFAYLSESPSGSYLTFPPRVEALTIEVVRLYWEIKARIPNEKL